MEVSGSISQTASMVLVQNMKEAGFTVDQQVMDWGTVLARRVRRDGWSMFSVYSNGTDMYSPLTNFYIASTCADYPGWSCDERIPAPAAILRAGPRTKPPAPASPPRSRPSPMSWRPTVMWGQFTIPAGYRKTLKNIVRSSYPIFWGVELAA